MSQLEIMTAVANGSLTPEAAQALLNKKNLKLKVSNKGAVQVNGLRKFPVTLYADEWRQVLAMKDEILAFVEANKDKLTSKGDAKVEETEETVAA
jgi:ApbE superfamily uncharacterized protein (UPF0280 family)